MELLYNKSFSPSRDDQEKVNQKKSPKSHDREYSSKRTNSKDSNHPYSSSSSNPSHSSPQHSSHNSADTVKYDPHADFLRDYQSASKTNQNTYQPAPENSFPNHFQQYKPEKDSFDLKRTTYEDSQAPKDPYESLKKAHKLQQEALKAVQESLRLPLIAQTYRKEDPAPPKISKVSTLDTSDKDKDTSKSSSYSSPTQKSSPPASSAKSKAPQAVSNAIKTPQTEEKEEIAVFAKKR